MELLHFQANHTGERCIEVNLDIHAILSNHNITEVLTVKTFSLTDHGKQWITDRNVHQIPDK